MKRFLITSALCLFSVPVLAQGSSITIIHEDGSQDVIDLEESVLDEKQDKRPVPDVVMEAEEIDEGDGATDIAPPVRKAEPVVKEQELPVVTEDVVESQEAKPAVVAAPPAEAVESAIPIPVRKPVRRVAAPVALSGPITAQMAMSIALDTAPPSRQVDVEPRMLDSGAAFAVLFKVDDGIYEVLVDQKSGDILSSAMLEQGSGGVKPGHLPVNRFAVP